MASANPAFASFEEKWLVANPEQAVVAVFLPPHERRIAGAFGSLVHELEQAAFGVREPQVAAAKLDWWRHELAAAAAGAARHPVSRELFEAAGDRASSVAWAMLVDGAAALLDAAAPDTLDASFERLTPFYRPVAAAEAVLLGLPGGSQANVDLWTGSQLLQSALAPEREAAHALALPLDLFARHGMTRADLARPGAARAALIGDFLRRLCPRLESCLGAAPHASLGRRVRARLDLRAAAAAAKRADPAEFLARAPVSRWRVLWLAWREARARAAAVPPA